MNTAKRTLRLQGMDSRAMVGYIEDTALRTCLVSWIESRY